MIKNLNNIYIETSKENYIIKENPYYLDEMLISFYDKINELIDEVNDLKKENEELKRKVDLL